MNKLPTEYYRHHDVVYLSRDLLGKSLFTNIGGIITGGVISETEAYEGAGDKASHAYGNRRTRRTEVMFGNGGIAYVYLCYGIHHLFNIVTNIEGIPHAILIRAIHPTTGLELIRERRKSKLPDHKMATGPGTVSSALGIRTHHTGTDLTGELIWVEDRGLAFSEDQVIAGPRIGVDYAGEDALLPYRFYLKPGTLK